MLMRRNTQSGLSLIEVLVAITISIILAAGVLGAFSTSLFGSQQTLQQGRLNRDLQAVMDIMVTDIQRAGYTSTATTSKTDPFMQGNYDLQVSGNCIVLAYDLDNNGTVDDADVIGYVLHNGAIERRQVGVGKTTDCASAATDSWDPVTDPNYITITAFTITKPASSNISTDIDGTSAGTDTITNRTVSITLTGQLTNDTSVTKTITRIIKVYNNKYAP